MLYPKFNRHMNNYCLHEMHSLFGRRIVLVHSIDNAYGCKECISIASFAKLPIACRERWEWRIVYLCAAIYK